MKITDILNAVRELVRGEIPLDNIKDILSNQKCLYLFNTKETKQELIERVVNQNAVKERYKACEPFFGNTSFPYAVIKGAVLSCAVCGDPFRRVSGDIDILINRRNADEAKQLLQNCGFIQGRVTSNGIVPFSRKEILFQTTTSHQTAPYVKKTDNPLCPYINVDLNIDILWGECDQHMDMDKVLAHREKTKIFDVDFYKLTVEMEFISLCLHHYKDMNSIYLLSEGSLCLGLFFDIYYYIRNVRPSLLRTYELSTELNVDRFVYTCLYYTMEIFDDKILQPYLDVFKESKDEKLIDSFGLNNNERKTWNITLAERLFHSNLPRYIESLLDDNDLYKIKTNRENM